MENPRWKGRWKAFAGAVEYPMEGAMEADGDRWKGRWKVMGVPVRCACGAWLVTRFPWS
jgi:hypothetical protein